VLRWSPDDLYEQAGAAIAEAAWTPESLPAVAVDSGFREDYSHTGPREMLDRLTSAERDALYQLASADLREEMSAEMEKRDRERQRVQEQFLGELSERMRELQEGESERIARGAVDLAIAMAGQILKAAVAVDRDVLVRALQVMLYKVRSGVAMTVTTNPADCEYLKSREEMMEGLNIAEVVPDPRIAQGGCQVVSDGQEWDLTLPGRLEVLAEAVRDAMRSGADDGEGGGVGLDVE